MAWITSRHAIRAALAAGQGRTLFCAAPPGRERDLIERARRQGVSVRTVDRSALRRMAGTEARNLALETTDERAAGQPVELASWLESAREQTFSLILALDHITDPHNLGAILRSSLLHSVDLVVLPSRRSAAATETVDRTSAGALRHVRMAWVGNLRSALRDCREAGYWVYGAEAGGSPAALTSLDRRAVLVVGSEGKGLSPVVGGGCDARLAIPAAVPNAAGVDSFNVSVATGILLYEYRRQVGFPDG